MNPLQNLHLVVIEYLYRGRRAVSLQTFTTWHSNRKLSIVVTGSHEMSQKSQWPKLRKPAIKAVFLDFWCFGDYFILSIKLLTMRVALQVSRGIKHW